MLEFINLFGNFLGPRDDDEIPDIDAETTISDNHKHRVKLKAPNVKNVKVPDVGKVIRRISDPYSDVRLGIDAAKTKAARKVKSAALKTKVGLGNTKDKLRKDAKVKAEGRKRKKN